MKYRILLLGGFLCLIGTTYLSYSMIAVYLSLDDLVKQSDKIVEGSIGDVRSFYNEDSSMIFTDVDIQVSGTWYGKSESSVSLRMLGGVVGEYGMSIDGVPVFQRNEQVVLFLRRIKNLQHFAPVGMAQGTFRVKSHGDNPKLERDLRGICFAGDRTETAFPERKNNLRNEINRSLERLGRK